MPTNEYSAEVLASIHECGLALMTPRQTSLITQGGEALLVILKDEPAHPAYINYWSGVFKTQMGVQSAAIQQAAQGSTPALRQVVDMLKAIKIDTFQ